MCERERLRVCKRVFVCASVCKYARVGVSVRVIEREREEMEQQLSGEEKTSRRRRKK